MAHPSDLICCPDDSTREAQMYACEYERFAVQGRDLFGDASDVRTLDDFRDLPSAMSYARRELDDENGLPLVWILDRETGELLDPPAPIAVPVPLRPSPMRRAA